jgi:hypothetical protein
MFPSSLINSLYLFMGKNEYEWLLVWGVCAHNARSIRTRTL